jgi:hypothetical protein
MTSRPGAEGRSLARAPEAARQNPMRPVPTTSPAANRAPSHTQGPGRKQEAPAEQDPAGEEEDRGGWLADGGQPEYRLRDRRIPTAADRRTATPGRFPYCDPQVLHPLDRRQVDHDPLPATRAARVLVGGTVRGEHPPPRHPPRAAVRARHHRARPRVQHQHARNHGAGQQRWPPAITHAFPHCAEDRVLAFPGRRAWRVAPPKASLGHRDQITPNAADRRQTGGASAGDSFLVADSSLWLRTSSLVNPAHGRSLRRRRASM